MMKVELSREEWNAVIAVLAQGPWQAVNPLMMKIGQQLQSQAESVKAPPRRANGTGDAPNWPDPVTGTGEPT